MTAWYESSNPTDPVNVVSARTTVVAITADGSVYGGGHVIAYTDRPTYIIERADGTRFSWIADMCYRADSGDPL